MMKKSGFTILELLIVVAIIAVLSAALVPLFRATRYDTQLAKVLADLDAIKTASMILHLDTGEWPIGASTEGYGLIDTVGIENIADWKGPYLDEWKDDPWGNPYRISSVTFGGSPFVALRVGSDGPDGRTSTIFDNIYLIITPDRDN